MTKNFLKIGIASLVLSITLTVVSCNLFNQPKGPQPEPTQGVDTLNVVSDSLTQKIDSTNSKENKSKEEEIKSLEEKSEEKKLGTEATEK